MFNDISPIVLLFIGHFLDPSQYVISRFYNKGILTQTYLPAENMVANTDWRCVRIVHGLIIGAGYSGEWGGGGWGGAAGGVNSVQLGVGRRRWWRASGCVPRGVAWLRSPRRWTASRPSSPRVAAIALKYFGFAPIG